MVRTELEKMGIDPMDCTVIRENDGVIVARVMTETGFYILKCFKNPEYRREIANYRLLGENGVDTLRIFAATHAAILMEDVAASMELRLGVKGDMSNPAMAKNLAKWYKKLHAIHADLTGMYDESDFFTRENIAYIKEKTGTENLPAWAALEENFDVLREKLDNLTRVVTYNDFYYTNLIVAHDDSRAFMFDYNLLGKGYALSDVRNVTYSLSEEAARAFMEEYGPTDPMEARVDAVISPVVTLCMACQRENFPEWGREALDEVKNNLTDSIARLVH